MTTTAPTAPGAQPGQPDRPGTPGTPGQPTATSDVESRWHYRRSLASRVTLLTTIAVALSVGLIAGGAYLSLRDQLQAQLDDSLLSRAHTTARAGLLSEVTASSNIPSWALGASDVSIAFLSKDASIGETGNARPMSNQSAPITLGAPELAVARGETDETVRTIVAGGTRYRVVAVPYTPGVALIIAKSLDEQEDVLDRIGLVILALGMVGVLVAGIAGWGVARNGLRPVRRLTTSVEGIARTEDLTVLPVEGDDEVARLATAFNQMLTALDASRDRQRRLVTDAGHELRTPLTSLRTNIDLLTQADESDLDLSPQARAEMLSDIRGQIEELTTLIGDLTELARDEPLAHVVGTVDLSEIVDQSISRVRRRAPGVTFDVTTEHWEVMGEARSLERAVTNLLDNAAKWSPTGGRVDVRLSGGMLTVDDQGPGVAEEDREAIFDRFWRASESRSMPGSGLGLAIVRQVAERHSGSVEAADSPLGGARLVLRLPGVARV